jgi:L,D-transpeptidase YcbB
VTIFIKIEMKCANELFVFWFVVITFAVISMTSCSNNNQAAEAQVPRDRTIVAAVAFTLLNLDSSAVELFISIEAKEKSLAQGIRNFYNNRNYQYAWFDEQGITEQGEAFWNLHEVQGAEDSDTSLSAQRLHDNMQLLLNEDTANFTGEKLAQTELDITLHFFKYMSTVFKPKVQPEEMQWHIPLRKINTQALVDSFLNGKDRDWKPLNQSFYRLQNKSAQYAAIAKAGGWPLINTKKGDFKKGASDTVIRQIKNRLKISGDYNGADTTTFFNAQLETVIKKIQFSYGLKESGVINAALIKNLNVSVEDRLRQMKINLERMRWMPLVGDGIFVNIPAYRLHVFEEKSEVLSMDIIVGKAANRTVIFSDKMQYIIFAPYWNVPGSIVRKEILPAMHRSSGYLSRNDMEVTGYSNGLPVIRQRPGLQNALGKIKFVFPNRYNIYLHDTPAKSLFENEKRAFSHGCIRIQKPFELAKYLLRNDKQWTDEKIRLEMNRSNEKLVKLASPVSVYIVYFTCWVDADGILQFREDVYGHDKRMAHHLFENE